MKQKYKLKEFGSVVVNMILSDDKNDLEAEATFGDYKDALRLLSESDKVESVELDPEQTEDSDTTFHFGKDTKIKKDSIRVVNPIIK